MNRRDAPGHITPEVIGFVVKRLLGKAGSGMSSDAMIAIALVTADGIPDGYDGPIPHDTADLARCCKAFELAPSQLQKRMLPVLAQWSSDLAARAAGLNTESSEAT